MLVDRLLRQGAMTEIGGPLSSGRTTPPPCAGRLPRRGCGPASDPPGPAAAGVDLGRVLWVRAEGRRRSALEAVDLLARCPGFALVALDVGESPPRLPPAAGFRLRQGGGG